MKRERRNAMTQEEDTINQSDNEKISKFNRVTISGNQRGIYIESKDRQKLAGRGKRGGKGEMRQYQITGV